MQTILIALIVLAISASSVLDTPKPFNFHWDTCGGSGVSIKSVSVVPDPIVLPGNITAHAAVTVGTTISSASLSHVDMTVEKSVEGFWIEIPCLDNIGSCTYTDPCSLLATVKDIVCPILSPAGLPCQCPIAAGNYMTPASGIVAQLPNFGWSWLTDGDVYVKANAVDVSGATALCVEIYLTIKEV